MPLSTDPETLKIPAFMRKRSLASRQKRPLILTALDRKRAGIPPEGMKKKETAVRKKVGRKSLARTALIQELPFFSATPPTPEIRRKIRSAQCKTATEKKMPSRRTTTRKRKTMSVRALRFPEPEIFSPPIIDTPAENIQKPIGKITHYYDKIKVGVIEITGKISVGDCISYETQDGGTYEQIIESMEINRRPVFNAKKGDDIGIKLRKTPQIDSKVYAT